MLYFSIILFYILFGFLAIKHIKWGVFTVLALLPTYLIRFTVLGLPTTLLEGMIWLLFIIWLIKLKQEKNLTFNPIIWIKNIVKLPSPLTSHYNPVPSSFRLPIILFLVAATIGMFISNNPQAAAGIWKAYFIEAIMFFIVFVYTIKQPADIKKAINFLSLPVVAIGIFAVIQKFTGLLIFNPFWQAEATRRITTFFGYPNANALFVLPIIFLVIGNLLAERKTSLKLYNILMIFLGTTTILLAKSSGGAIGLLIGVIALLIFYKKTRLPVLIIILASIISIFFYQPALNKIKDTYISINEIHLPINATDFQLRAQQWRETWAMLKQKPLTGAGLSGYQTAVQPFHQNQHIEIFMYPHNFVLNFWTETGLLGLVSIIWIIIAFFWAVYKSLKYNKILTSTVCSAMIAILVHGIVDVPYFKNDLSILFWVIIGLMIILYNQKATVILDSRAKR